MGLSISARAVRRLDGRYETVILNLDTGEEDIIASFDGPGKMKNARKLSPQILGK